MKKQDKTALIVVLPLVLIIGIYIYIKENPIDTSALKNAIKNKEANLKPDWFIDKDIENTIEKNMQWYKDSDFDYDKAYKKWVNDWGEDWRVTNANDYLKMKCIEDMQANGTITAEQKKYLENLYGFGYKPVT